MDCYLPSNAFQISEASTDVYTGDSTRCVRSDGFESDQFSLSINDVPTFDHENGPCDNSLFGNEIKADGAVSSKLNTHLAANLDLIDSNVIRSPNNSSIDRLIRSKRGIQSSFALDGSISNVELDINGNVPTDPCLLNAPENDSITCTPVKSSKSGSMCTVDSRRSMKDRPCLNISSDDSKNPILASYARSMRYKVSDTADVRRSLRVLGNSRCWTDRYVREDGVISDDCTIDDNILATQSPIRSLYSLVDTSRSSASEFTPRLSSRCIDYTPVRTPGASIRMSTTSESGNRFRNVQIDNFSSFCLSDMRKNSFNPMCDVTISKDIIMNMKLCEPLEMLYKHFKNVCTVIRRSSMRNGHPYFKVIQLLVQRMSRKVFTMDHLRQIAWLAPNLLSLKWVMVNESVRKKYKNEYKDCCNDVIYDIQLKLHRPDGRMCTSTIDYENICFRFKSILYGWVCKCKSEHAMNNWASDNSSGEFNSEMSLPIPMVELSDKYNNSNYSTPSRDDCTPDNRVSLDSPVSTPFRNSNRILNTHKTPIKSTGNIINSENRKSITPCSIASSAKRMRTTDVMSPMSIDLLDTPGMRSIKENAKKLSESKVKYTDHENNLKYWNDIRWFIKILLDIIIDDNKTPVMRLELLVDFIVKYGSRRVTQDQVDRWITTLSEIAPDILDRAISKFEDYSTIITINPLASFDAAVDYVNKKINELKSKP